MSPEQAAGRIEMVGPASDVYSLGAYGRVLRRSGQEDQAIEAGREVRTLGRGDPRLLYDAASVLASCVHASDREVLGEEAVATLREAVAAGWSDAALMLNDPALAAIRDRPDFQEIVAGLLDKALDAIRADPFAH